MKRGKGKNEKKREREKNVKLRPTEDGREGESKGGLGKNDKMRVERC